MSITTGSNNDRFIRTNNRYGRLEGQRDDMLRAANPNWNKINPETFRYEPYKPVMRNIPVSWTIDGEYHIDNTGRWSAKRNADGSMSFTKSVTTEPTTNKGKTEMEYAVDDKALHVDNVEIEHYNGGYTTMTLEVKVPTKDLKTIHRVVADVVELIEELDVK